MNNYDFLDLFLDGHNTYIYFGCLTASLLIYYSIFRGYFKSVFDPLLVTLVFSCFGSGMVFFLFVTHSITSKLFMSFLLTQTAYFVGLFCFYRKSGSEPSRSTPNNFLQINSCFFFFCFITIASNVITYQVRGIPLLMPSRLEAFVGGTGIGILSRLMDVSTLCAILSYYLLLSNPSVFKVRILHHLLFISLIVFLVLSGSKAAFLNLVFCLFCLERFYPGLRAKLKSIPPFSILKNKVVVGLVGLTLALAIVALQKAETPLNPYMELAYRFMLSGDVYYLSYPNNVYKLIENEHGFLALFQDFLGLFRIYAWDELPQAIGLDLTRYHHSGDLMWGPNARHNVFGLVYYGFVGSIIFSFSLGAVVSFVREKVLIMPFNNVFFYLFFSLLYIKITFVETDPMLALSYLSNVFLIFPMLLLIFLVLYDQLVIFRRINI